MNAMKETSGSRQLMAYWYSARPNFGDLLTPIILKHYGFNWNWHPIKQAQVLVVGSILQDASEGFSGHIIGSGLIRDIRCQFKDANIWLLRGKLTKERISAPIDTAVGDPGLLSSKLIKNRMNRVFPLGIVPHLVDMEDPRIAKIKDRYKRNILVIDVGRNPQEVLEDIDKCNCILSSSLHGLIVAHSLRIPCAWIYLSDKVIGNGFKFRDYFSAIGVEHRPQCIDGTGSLSMLVKYACSPPNSIGEVEDRIDNIFRQFKQYIS